jgi:hypothetical protein
LTFLASSTIIAIGIIPAIARIAVNATGIDINLIGNFK